MADSSPHKKKLDTRYPSLLEKSLLEEDKSDFSATKRNVLDSTAMTQSQDLSKKKLQRRDSFSKLSSSVGQKSVSKSTHFK